MNNFQLFTTSKIKILYLLCRGVVQQAHRLAVSGADNGNQTVLLSTYICAWRQAVVF